MLLSIITINYNNADGLRKTIESVKMQKDADQMEYIIIDGGSTDGSKEIIIEAGHAISQWVSEPDKGIYNAMNKGVRMASGKYCLFLNSGDVLHSPSVIESVLPHLSDDAPDFIIGKVLYTNGNWTSDTSKPLSMNRFYNGSIPHPSTVIKTERLRNNPYDETFKIVSDWKFFVEELIVKNAPYKFIDDIITDFDCEGISATNKALVDKERETVLGELFPERVILDYIQFKNGSDYQSTPYDKFFIKLRDFRSAKIIYSLDVIIMRIASWFKKGLRFAKNFPIKLPNK